MRLRAFASKIRKLVQTLLHVINTPLELKEELNGHMIAPQMLKTSSHEILDGFLVVLTKTKTKVLPLEVFLKCPLLDALVFTEEQGI